MSESEPEFNYNYRHFVLCTNFNSNVRHLNNVIWSFICQRHVIIIYYYIDLSQSVDWL